MKKEKIILLNKMYSGTYLTDGNLGHEVINLYKSDNGKNYIYLLSDGKLKKEYSGRISCVLLVKQHENHLIEILGKATGIEEIYSEEKKDKEYQKNYIIKENIRYGGVLLSNIFQGDDYQDICITFKADKVVVPKEPIYIQYAMGANKDLPILVDINRGQSSHQFVNESNEEAYKTLSEIINDSDSWGDEVKTVDETEKSMVDIPPYTIFDICRTSYSELAYSSGLGYFLRKYKEFADTFLSEVLKINSVLSNDYTVHLETVYRIDIFITDKDKNIIIENKIKSGINGVYTDKQKKDKDNQLERYYKDVCGDKQLKNKKTYAYLLTPNYNDIDISNLNPNYGYKTIKYSDLHKVMKSCSAYENDSDFKIFTDAIEKHTSKYDNELRDEMFRIFAKRLSSAKK
ncbi:MAG: PD-(D/E)XK nuclease family protein [Rikenellaceae bacterium]